MVTTHHAKESKLMIRVVFNLAIIFAVISCASSGEKELSDDKVVHVVLLWLKEPGNNQHIQKIIDTSYKLHEIPELIKLRVGKSIPSDRKIVDDSFDVGLYMTFNNEEDMQLYLDHPKHKEIVKSVLKPLVSRILVYDFVTAK